MNGKIKAKAVADKLRSPSNPSDQVDQVSEAEGVFGESAVAVLPDLKPLSKVGMSKVDPLDIRPPMILLVQKSSVITEMVDKNGTEAKVGQFYHTGDREILSVFDCHILYAAKGKWINRRKSELGELPQYSALGVIKSNVLSEPPRLFAMFFRSSAEHCLSGLFSAAQSQQAPMFSFNVSFETKQLEGKLGTWYVPVCRVHDIETDPERFNWLYMTALQLDKRSDAIPEDMGGEDEQ